MRNALLFCAVFAASPAVADQPKTGNALTRSGALSDAEQTAFIVAVQQCWNLEPGLPAVTVAFSLDENARPLADTIALTTAAPDAAIEAAFLAARRAILRCGGKGFGLPPDKYALWRDVIITFNPEGMRLQ